MQLTPKLAHMLMTCIPRALMIVQDGDGSTWWTDDVYAVYDQKSHVWRFNDGATYGALGTYLLSDRELRVFKREAVPQPEIQRIVDEYYTQLMLALEEKYPGQDFELYDEHKGTATSEDGLTVPIVTRAQLLDALDKTPLGYTNYNK